MFSVRHSGGEKKKKKNPHMTHHAKPKTDLVRGHMLTTKRGEKIVMYIESKMKQQR